MAKIVTDDVLTELVSRLKGGINSKANKEHHHTLVNLSANLLRYGNCTQIPEMACNGESWFGVSGPSGSEYKLYNDNYGTYVQVSLVAGAELEYELGDYHGGNELESGAYTLSIKFDSSGFKDDTVMKAIFHETNADGEDISTEYEFTKYDEGGGWDYLSATHSFLENSANPSYRYLTFLVTAPTACIFWFTDLQLEKGSEPTPFTLTGTEQLVQPINSIVDEKLVGTIIRDTSKYDDFNDFDKNGTYILQGNAYPHRFKNCPPLGLSVGGSYKLEVEQCYSSTGYVTQVLSSTFGYQYFRAKETVWTPWQRVVMADSGMTLGDGVNLLAGADFADLSKWSLNDSTVVQYDDWTRFNFATNGSKRIYYTGTETTTLTIGETYTLSLDYYTDNPSISDTLTFQFKEGTNTFASPYNRGAFGAGSMFLGMNTVQKVAIPFVATHDTPFTACLSIYIGNPNTNVFIKNLKIEKGSVVTSGAIGEGGDYVSREEFEAELENFAPITYEDCNVSCSGIDERGVYTVVTYSRVASATTYMTSTLSNKDNSGNYLTCTWRFYDVGGTLTKTQVWTIAYDDNNTITNATLN